MRLFRHRWVSLLGLAIVTALGLLLWFQQSSSGLSLQILHASDFEAGIPALEDAVNFSSVLNTLKREMPNNTLVLSSGDNFIMGPFFSASADPQLRQLLGREGNGRGDIAIMNALGVQAAAWGNHEFDEGTGRISDLFVADEKGYQGAKFPYLAANLNFEQDPNLKELQTADAQLAESIPQRIAHSAIVTVAGEKIGLVGVTTPLLPIIASPGPGVTVLPQNPEDIPGLAATVQPVVDHLTRQGINKIILLSHLQQLGMEIQLAAQLQDVDVIIAGGSHAVLTNNLERVREGDKVLGRYPVWKTSKTKEPIAIVNTGANYRYVGRLLVEFDHQGRLKTGSKANPDYVRLSDAYPTLHPGTAPPSPEVVTLIEAIRSVIMVKDAQQYGQAKVFLNGSRRDVRTQETNLGNLTADANLAAAQKIDPTVKASLKNGGGIRDNIGAISGLGGNSATAGERLPTQANPTAKKKMGDISRLDIENSLRFNNSLTLLTLTAVELKQVLEHGVAATSSLTTPGQFPQVAGLAFSFDPEKPANQRVQSLALRNAQGQVTDVLVKNGQLQGNPNRTMRIVTLNYLADGGDAYPFPTFTAANPSRVQRVDLVSGDTRPTFDTPGSEQKALADYLQANFRDTPYTQADLPPEQDERIQNLSVRKDTVI
ncbi:5'-nucleotidase C-terminal domain-containing protein [Thermosynechococcaceae cyanobacterium BACA0444]|uniref:5'-nucleotidase C-terminal domain-containing protein n=1 Tax=Pseudocalidococcus azoricus BACA0444 TaxID=2918990 RepID=A0AAE4K0D2_9CYAN|nr:5'-nucleotidase C-terminal domain-containing protein [Pseudocalidococcus azoricus]MDS3861837.1 5'-nucleotidase C-terminal domain-containing protein [Pseudocalidococcus azoricus BACA0444]